VNGEEAVKVFDLAVKGKSLPATMDGLVPLSFIGAAAVKFYQAKVKLMDQLGVSEAQRAATLADGQDAGEMLLNIEARIGELLPPADEARSGKGKKREAVGPRVGQGGSTRDIEPRAMMVGRNAIAARAIKANPAAVAAVIKEARENEDIPTKTAVLKHIQYEKEKARREKVEEQPKSKTEMSLDWMNYILSLERIIAMLPPKPPKDATEEALAEARGYAQIIMKRLEVFNE
jgi:hypothetical protein